MSTPQPSAATSAPAPAGGAPARANRDSAEAPAAKESLYAHARRSLKTAALAAATATQSTARRATIPALDIGIALLQSLRKRIGADKAAGDDGAGSKKGRPGGRRDDADTQANTESPAPRRRLRASMVYLGVLLAGGMGGGVLAYQLLEERFNHRIAEEAPPAVVKSGNTAPIAATKKIQRKRNPRTLMRRNSSRRRRPNLRNCRPSLKMRRKSLRRHRPRA